MHPHLEVTVTTTTSTICTDYALGMDPSDERFVSRGECADGLVDYDFDIDADPGLWPYFD